MIEFWSRFLYGTSHVNISHSTTPNENTSTFSEHASFLMTSGAIQATQSKLNLKQELEYEKRFLLFLPIVPLNDISVLFSLRLLQAPKSLILRESL